MTFASFPVTYLERKCRRPTSVLRGVSSDLKTIRAEVRSRRSSSSRYFCCRRQNRRNVTSAPSASGSPCLDVPFCAWPPFRHAELCACPFETSTPPPSSSAEVVPNRSDSASSHSPARTADLNAATLGISSSNPLSRESCSAAPRYPRSLRLCNKIRVTSSLSWPKNGSLFCTAIA